ncbi:MAG: hypothetical protein E7610_05830 [Ruminococcaceae bacterium]|nr:hypothetical protein [Oscillospiraceae bacterium]
MKSGATVSIPVAMLFKKYYCHKCGKLLKRQKVTEALNPGDPGYEAAKDQIFDNHMIVGTRGPISVTHYVLQCAACNTTITFDEQEDIAVKQKYAKSRIL